MIQALAQSFVEADENANVIIVCQNENLKMYAKENYARNNCD